MALTKDYAIIPEIEIDGQIIPGVALANVYIQLGRIDWDFFHQRCDIWVYIWHSEAARRQHAAVPDALRAPLTKVQLPQVPIHLYEQYLGLERLSTSGWNPLRALYAYVTEVPEPWGLAGMLADAERHGL